MKATPEVGALASPRPALARAPRNPPPSSKLLSRPSTTDGLHGEADEQSQRWMETSRPSLPMPMGRKAAEGRGLIYRDLLTQPGRCARPYHPSKGPGTQGQREGSLLATWVAGW